MKKTMIFSLLSVALVLTGCKESFLEVEPYTRFGGETYYSDSTHIYQALVAAYSPLEWNDWNGSQYAPQNIMSDIMADDMWPGGASAMDNQFWHLMMNYEAQPLMCLTGVWSNMYVGVKLCNDLIDYAESAHSAEGQAKGFYLATDLYNEWTAEARVLRAYYYNLLWKFYGNIPFYTKNVAEPPYQIGQIKADEVYNNVIQDLESAINTNALAMKRSGDQLGRVTQAMAYMLYAEMVMYQNDTARFPTALGYMRQIINSPEYNLYNSYTSLWESTAEWCEESIFEIDYTDDKTFRGWGTGDAIIAGGTVLPTLITPQSCGGLGDGWGFCPIRVSTYSMFETGDARRDMSAHRYDNYKARYQDTGYWLEKYIAKPANSARAQGDHKLNYNNNLRIYRYAETLLNAAELIARTTDMSDKTSAAYQEASNYLNAVRQRAFNNDPSIVIVDPTIDNIMRERHLEFVGEGKRYWDLVRAEGIAEATEKASTKLGPDEYRTNRWSADRKYLPIPYSEIAADPSLEQNPGY